MKSFKQYLQESPKNKKVIFAFGRFQPPTLGHKLLVDTVVKLAHQHNSDHIIYVSATQDKKKNPLSAERKVFWLKKMFPGVNFVAAPSNIKTPSNAFVSISKKYGNYSEITIVCGSDRLESYKDLINKYNWENNLYDKAEVVSAGERDPDSDDDVSSVSGTKMRKFAVADDFESFRKGVSSNLTDKEVEELMQEIRKGLGK